MEWTIDIAKNREKTLKLNGNHLYSKYRPREDAWKWVESQFDSTFDCYLLIGLGLGYHAEKLVELAAGKAVYVYYFDQIEYSMAPIDQAVQDIGHVDLSHCQILIPNAWLKAIGNHPIMPFLEDIKINQITYKKTAHLLERNFEKNQQLGDFLPFEIQPKKVAVLIASGPSLNETIHWVNSIKEKTDVYVVGSALKMVLAHQIKPAAVIVSDPKPIMHQLTNHYNGPLLYVSTANHETVIKHKGPRHLLCQYGYKRAEELAYIYGLTLIETGGSVATAAFSMIEHLNYETLIMFGQDLGFVGTRTHAEDSTSGRYIQEDLNVRQVESNGGMLISTTPNLHTYLRWFNRQVPISKMNVYNTAKLGAKIEGAPYVSQHQLIHLLESL